MERQNHPFHARTLYFDRRHLGETNLRATALDLRSEDHECKTYKPLVENHCCYPSNRRFIETFITEVSQQSCLTKMAAVNFLISFQK